MSDSVLTSLGHWAATADAALAHAAGWVLGKLDAAKADLATLEAGSPLVAEGLAAAQTYAVAHGVPVAALENAGSALLTLVQKVAAPGGAA